MFRFCPAELSMKEWHLLERFGIAGPPAMPKLSRIAAWEVAAFMNDAVAEFGSQRGCATRA